MRCWLAVLVCLVLPLAAAAQTREVHPGELALTVGVDPGQADPVRGEMVLITIQGVYRRHITRETLRQPDFDGFSWAQLGPDHWSEERVEGKQVKIFRRRMAVYPDRTGALTIGAFTHDVTLTDEGDDWFDHKVVSAPVTIEVAPAPAHDGWWFPVRRLQVSDQWSNAPDQLKPGEGVLRVVRIDALGVTPEMIPPMPELASPSAMIFPHPEQRLVELTPEGPVTHAYWRWTIRPSNDVSTVVEPMTFGYFDTLARVAREVTISPQRVAYGGVAPPSTGEAAASAPVEQAQLPGWPVSLVAVLVFAGGVALGLRGRRLDWLVLLRRIGPLDPLRRQMDRAARAGDCATTRRLAAAALRRDGHSLAREALLRELDRLLFDPAGPRAVPADFARRFFAR